jgi:hypothetical protein
MSDPGAALIDEMPGLGFGWIAPTPGYMRRASHAILADGRVWYTDPVWDPDMLARARALGPAGGVIQMLDRHPRDCVRVAEDLGVPLYVVPDAAPEGAPFRVIPVDTGLGRWHEIALWFGAEQILCVAEAAGGAPYFRAPGASLGPHPVLRVVHPPRRLCGYPARHVLCGHGAGLHAEDAGAQLERCVMRARRDSPRWGLALVGIGRD